MQDLLRVLPALVCSAFAHTVGLLEPGVIHDERIMASEKPFPKKKYIYILPRSGTSLRLMGKAQVTHLACVCTSGNDELRLLRS